MTVFNLIGRAENRARTVRREPMAGVGTQDMMQNLVQNMTTDNVRNTTTIIVMLPIMLIYPFLQKYFAKGITMGAVKG